MFKLKFTLFFIFIFTFSFAQTELAVVSAPNVKVREQANSAAQVSGQIEEGKIFWASKEALENGWVAVNYLKETTEVNQDENALMLDGRILSSGYVQEREIRRLNEAGAMNDYFFNMDAGPDHFIANDSLTVSMLINRCRGAVEMNKNEMWGTEADLPKFKMEHAYFKFKKQKYDLNAKGFFEPNFDSISIVYDEQSEDYILSMSNGDGTEAYLCVWQIELEGKVTRYAFKPR